MKTQMTQLLVSFILILASSISSYSQSNVTLSNDEQEVKGTKVYEYAETPDYVFIHKRINVFKKMTEEQLVILESFDYPKFKATGGKDKMEYDALQYEKAIQRWYEENMYRAEEIREAFGIED